MTVQDIINLIKGYQDFMITPEGTWLDAKQRQRFRYEISKWQDVLDAIYSLEGTKDFSETFCKKRQRMWIVKTLNNIDL